MTTQEQFLNDLQQYILNHPYYKQSEGTHQPDTSNDRETFEIHDPNGDYERVTITIQGIA